MTGGLDVLAGPLCVALDRPDDESVQRLAMQTAEHAGLFKLGLTAFTRLGPAVVTRLAERRPVFLDLKLHDIPAQVEGAIAGVEAAGASFTTVHALGGAAMVRAAVSAASRVRVLAVTVLTSLDATELASLGFREDVEATVVGLARRALQAGADGLVCSPLEVAALRREFGSRREGGPWLVVPGVRPTSSATDDQLRTAGPRATLERGADVLVVGRPVTTAPDPTAAVADLVAEIARAG
ncbi:orotidine-5'-phosphate decarboxylase [soil metagenome]